MKSSEILWHYRKPFKYLYRKVVIHLFLTFAEFFSHISSFKAISLLESSNKVDIITKLAPAVK